MNKVKFYIVGPEDKGEGAYYLVAESGEGLAAHFCSNVSFAKWDLIESKPERQREWIDRFGDYEVLMLGDDDMKEDELIRRNENLENKRHHDQSNQNHP